jgi:K+-transporting ATPase KdpF subunit
MGRRLTLVTALEWGYRARPRIHHRFDSVLCPERSLCGGLRSADEVRCQVGLDSIIGLLVSVATLAYLVAAMLMPEKF